MRGLKGDTLEVIGKGEPGMIVNFRYTLDDITHYTFILHRNMMIVKGDLWTLVYFIGSAILSSILTVQTFYAQTYKYTS